MSLNSHRIVGKTRKNARGLLSNNYFPFNCTSNWNILICLIKDNKPTSRESVKDGCCCSLKQWIWNGFGPLKEWGKPTEPTARTGRMSLQSFQVTTLRDTVLKAHSLTLLYPIKHFDILFLFASLLFISSWPYAKLSINVV